ADSSYFSVFSTTGELLYATYVPNSGFDFAAQNESSAPSQPAVVCFANAAGHLPLIAAAPGQLIAITGGGFGPASPMYTTPDSDGKYPLTAGGFHVRIAGTDVPILAIARGLILVQVPYDIVQPLP